MTYRPHPLQALNNISHLLYLMIIPVVRGIYYFLSSGFTQWSNSLWVDLLTLIVIVALGIIRYYCFTYKLTDSTIEVDRGVFIRQHITIPYDSVVTTRAIGSYFYRPFKARNLHIDTYGGGSRKWDLTMLVHKKHYEEINNKIFPEKQNQDITYKSSMLYTVVFSLISSNSLVGIVIIATLITRMGEILGRQVQELIVGTFQNIISFIGFGIPPVAVAIAYVIISGWMVGFVINVIRYKNLKVKRCGRELYIQSGIFTKRQYSLKPSAVNYLDIKQSLLAGLVGLYFVSVNTIGYGKEKRGVEVLIPTATRKNLMPIVKKLLPDFIITKPELRPNFGALIRFTADPLYPTVLIPLIGYLLILFFPIWRELISLIIVISMVPTLWFLAIRLWDWATGGIAFHKGYYSLRYSKGFYLHRVIIAKTKVASVTTRQSIFQKMSGRCDVFIYSYGEGSRMHRLRNLEEKAVYELFSLK